MRNKHTSTHSVCTVLLRPSEISSLEISIDNALKNLCTNLDCAWGNVFYNGHFSLLQKKKNNKTKH